jgi:hypothetical protein
VAVLYGRNGTFHGHTIHKTEVDDTAYFLGVINGDYHTVILHTSPYYLEAQSLQSDKVLLTNIFSFFILFGSMGI